MLTNQMCTPLGENIDNGLLNSSLNLIEQNFEDISWKCINVTVCHSLFCEWERIDMYFKSIIFEFGH